jgi:hypothetical protein
MSESRGIKLIAAERQRQVEILGYTSDEYEGTEMVDAAMCYLDHYVHGPNETHIKQSELWPWEDKYWKPARGADRLRDLVKAAALVAAEIDMILEQSDGDIIESKKNDT